MKQFTCKHCNRVVGETDQKHLKRLNGKLTQDDEVRLDWQCEWCEERVTWKRLEKNLGLRK